MPFWLQMTETLNYVIFIQYNKLQYKYKKCNAKHMKQLYLLVVQQFSIMIIIGLLEYCFFLNH